MKSLLKVLLVDAVLLASVYYVIGDLQWRVAAAAARHGHTSGYVSTFTYSLFTQVFTMSGGGATLPSPPTLDWLQVIGLFLALVNGWYLFSVYSRRKRPFHAAPSPSPGAQ